MSRGHGAYRSRAALATLAALTAVSALGACSGDNDPPAPSGARLAECQPAAPSGTFEYDDARGRKVTLDEVPSTVVAQSSVAAGLWDAGYEVDGIYGEVDQEDPAVAYQMGNVDLDDLDVIGRRWGEFDVDQYAAMKPDLIVDYTFDNERLWYVPREQARQVEELAPSVAVNGEPRTIDTAIQVFVDLAERLGADTRCNEELNADRKDYEEALAAVAESEKDLEVLVASASESSLWVVNPDFLPETGTLRRAGVDLMDPKGGEPAMFHEYRWPRAVDYADADVILMDARTPSGVVERMKGIDAWTELPAVKAGQVYKWYAAAPYSYKEYAEIFAELAENLRRSRPVD
jgi:iron complex transport system substrate-binding protein